jgi:CMD domain protein
MTDPSAPPVVTTRTALPDVIDSFAGIAPDSPLARLRAQRPDVVRYAQESDRILLAPDDPGGVSHSEREMVALRVAVLTPDPVIAAWHRERLRVLGASDATIAAVERFPDGGSLSERAAAILRHTDLLTREPGAAMPEHLAALKAVGLGPRDIVVISQLIALLSFQVRLVAGLRLLAEDA